MSFGFSISDIGHVILLAWEVCRVYRRSLDEFETLSADASSLRAVLEQAGEAFQQRRPLCAQQEERLKVVSRATAFLLRDLGLFLEKYESLATGDYRRRDRLQWSPDEADKLRSRMTHHISIITALYTFTVNGLTPEPTDNDHQSHSGGSIDNNNPDDLRRYFCSECLKLSVTADTAGNASDRSFFDGLGFQGDALTAGWGEGAPLG